jgi:hypothetical protein
MSSLVLDRAPDFTSGGLTFEEYETSPEAAIFYDDPATKSHIRTVPADAYLLGALHEEYAETLEFDANPPEYSRIGMLALASDDELLPVYREDATQLERHRKEFGDLLWYSSALLRRAGMNLSGATRLKTFAELDAQAVLFADEVPLVRFRSAFDTFAIASADTLTRSGEPRQMANALHTLLGTVAWVAQDRLHTTLADIAVGNMQKIARRQKDGTVYGSGDDR